MGVREIRPQGVDLRRIVGRLDKPRRNRLIEGHGLGLQAELPGYLDRSGGAVQQRAVEIEEMKSGHGTRG